MDCGGLSSDGVIAKLMEMGFEDAAAVQAVKEVGPSLDDAVEYVLSGCRGNSESASTSSRWSATNRKVLGKRTLSSSSTSLGQPRQSSILDHFQSTVGPKRSRMSNLEDAAVSATEEVLHFQASEVNESFPSMGYGYPNKTLKSLPVCSPDEEGDVGSDWEQRANSLLQKHFGYSSLKSFQKEALAAWVAHQDCLVLSATGSGKSLCFQIPALLTGKVVVVISPLISLMHDQCLKLSKHGVSACFLGSGQPDNSVENKAMKGVYDIIYVCPETVLRLIKPLQSLAEIRGIALFAIDEVHCVSKWGHDFRPEYRRLSVLRENFSDDNLKFLKFDIPVMALTATATVQVRKDILKSLNMSKETRIVLTSFFRPNLRFLVKHSRTSFHCYGKDFSQLVNIYGGNKRTNKEMQNMTAKRLNECPNCSAESSISESDRFYPSDADNVEDAYSDVDDNEVNESTVSQGKEMSIEYLENEVDVFQSVDDWDVACGEFCPQPPCKKLETCGISEIIDIPNKLDDRTNLLQEPLEEGPTIIYVPTRKETLNIAKYLCVSGVKAAAYNAGLPKSHLRLVHLEFHENKLQVVVATVAFGMGIDKLNVRRIIHYGWPQSLESYYQEAGRAGRDGKLAECILYTNLSRIPTLLPSKRSEDQAKQAHKMLSDCYRYVMNTSCCRPKKLVEYFGEDFSCEKCLLCDVCVGGPPKLHNLTEEADVLMQVISAYHEQSSFSSHDLYGDSKPQKSMKKPNLRMFVSKIREQSQKFWSMDQLWWRGLARILEDKGYIREADEKVHVQIKFPEPTKKGLEFLEYAREEPFNCYPEADMLLSMNRSKSYSTFSNWGKGWADPEIRRQRLERKGSNRKPRKRNSRKLKPDPSTARGRIAAKILKRK